MFTTFKVFLGYVENQFSTSIKTLCIDSRGEYISNDFKNFLQHKGIISQKTCPYTPQQNGVSEWKNRYLPDIVRSLLLESSVLAKFSPESLSIAIHIMNRLPSPRIQNETPYFYFYFSDASHVFSSTYFCLYKFCSSTFGRTNKTLCPVLQVRIFRLRKWPKRLLMLWSQSELYQGFSQCSVFENQYFLQHHHDNDQFPLISLVPNFDENPILPWIILSLFVCMKDVDGKYYCARASQQYHFPNPRSCSCTKYISQSV